MWRKMVSRLLFAIPMPPRKRDHVVSSPTWSLYTFQSHHVIYQAGTMFANYNDNAKQCFILHYQELGLVQCLLDAKQQPPTGCDKTADQPRLARNVQKALLMPHAGSTYMARQIPTLAHHVLNASLVPHPPPTAPYLYLPFLTAKALGAPIKRFGSGCAVDTGDGEKRPIGQGGASAGYVQGRALARYREPHPTGHLAGYIRNRVARMVPTVASCERDYAVRCEGYAPCASEQWGKVPRLAELDSRIIPGSYPMVGQSAYPPLGKVSRKGYGTFLSSLAIPRVYVKVVAWHAASILVCHARQRGSPLVSMVERREISRRCGDAATLAELGTL